MSSTRFHVLLALVAFAPLARAANEADSAEVISRIYPLGGILPPKIESDINVLTLSTIPLEQGGALDSFGNEIGQRIIGEDLLELLSRTITADEWQLPGRAITVEHESGPMLVVSAPQQTHLEIERCLRFLSSHFRRSLRVRTEIYSIGNAAGIGAVPDGDARSWINGLVSSGALVATNDVSLGLMSGTPRLWNRIHSRSTVRQYEHEIAQRTSSPSPSLDLIEVGDRLLLRADCGMKDQVALRFIAQRVEEARPPRRVDSMMSSSVTTNEGVLETSREVTIESPQLAFSTLGGSVALSLNQTRACFVAPSGSDEMDRSGMLVAFTLESVSPAEHEFRSGDRTLMLFDLAADAAMGCQFPQRNVLTGISEVIHFVGTEFQSVAAFGIASTSGIVLRTLVTVRDGIEGAAEGNDWSECFNGFLFLMGENSSRIASALEQALAARDDGSCRGSLDSAPKRTGRSALFDLPIGQTPSIAYSGFAETILSQIYTDVAESSASTHSAAASLVTGRFWRLEGSARSAPGNVSIRFDHRLRRGDPTVIAEKVGSSARLERVDVDHNSFAEELTSGQDSATYPHAFSLLEGTGTTAVLTSGNIVIERRGNR